MLTSTTQPSIRARVLARFPAQVLAGAGMAITRQGGAYIFSTVPPVDLPLSGLEDIPANTVLGRGASGTGPVMASSISGGLVFTAGNNLQLSDNQRSRSFTAIFNAAAAGNQQDFVIPLACSITRITLLANAAGNAVIDIYKTSFADFPGTAANSICASAKPTLSAALKYQDAVLTGWIKSLIAGDILRLNIDSVATITRLSVSIEAITI